MTWFGYTLLTPYGTDWPYTDESNIAQDAPIPRGLFYSLQNPALGTQQTGRAIFIYPTAPSPFLVSDPRIEIAARHAGEQIGVSAEGIPIYLGVALVAGSLPRGAEARAVDLSLFGQADPEVRSLGVVAAFVVILVLLAVIAVAWASTVWMTQLTEQERIRTQSHLADLALQSQEVLKEEEIDINGDGIPDERLIYYRNGDVLAIALTAAGEAALGGPSKLLRKGIDGADLLGALGGGPGAFDWGTAALVGAVAVGVGLAGYAVYKYRRRRRN